MMIFLAFLYLLVVFMVFNKMRKYLWSVFPVVIIPMFIAGLISGFSSWWSNPVFWGWFIGLSFLITLPLGIYFQLREKNENKRVGVIYKTTEAEVLKDNSGFDLLAKKIAEALTTTNLRKFIVGQEEAIEKISDTVKLCVKELEAGNDKRKKILSSFILVGTTGVGKTETAKAVSKLLEPLGYSFVRIDMNQFRDEHSIWTLLGSPRGYIGSEKGGYLTNALKENPKRVILFDEVEKAHPDVISFLLQFLDEGYVIERESGEKYEAKLSIVFFTSNLYSKEIGEIALRTDIDEVDREITIRKMLEGFFKPEFLGRIDEVVPYTPLSFENLVEIARRELKKLNAEERAYELAKKYYHLAKNYGVRLFLKKIVREAVKWEEKGIDFFS